MWVSTFCVLTGHRELKRVIWVISRHLQVELLGLRGSSQRCGLFFFSVFAAGDFTKLGDFFFGHHRHQSCIWFDPGTYGKGVELWNPPPYRGDGRMTTAHIPCFEHGELVHLGFKWTQSKQCIGIDWEYDGDITNKMIWRFPKSWGYPQFSSIFMGFSMKQTIHFGGNLIYANPHMDV